jgi:ribosomal protein L7/L12
MLQRRALNLLRKPSSFNIIVNKSDSNPQKFSEYASKYSNLVDEVASHNQAIWDRSSDYKKHKINLVSNALDDMTSDEKAYLKFLIAKNALQTHINEDLATASSTKWKIPVFSNQNNFFDDLQEKMTISTFLNSNSGSSAKSDSKGEAVVAENVEEEEQEVIVSVQTKFTVNLLEVPAAKKLVTIKEVKSMLGIGLKDAKDLVENLPAEIKKDVDNEEVEKLKEKFDSLGCVIGVV